MATKFGAVGDLHTSMVFGGDDTAKNTVAMLFIDDKDRNKRGGSSLINPAVKQAGVSFVDQQKSYEEVRVKFDCVTPNIARGLASSAEACGLTVRGFGGSYFLYDPSAKTCMEETTTIVDCTGTVSTMNLYKLTTQR